MPQRMLDERGMRGLRPSGKHDFRPSGRKSVRGRRGLRHSGRNAMLKAWFASSQSQSSLAKTICVRQVAMPQRMLDLRPSDYAAAKQA